MADVSEALERLAALRDRGILTQAEFDAQKAALLSPAPAPAPAYRAAPVAAGGSNAGIWIVVAVGVFVVLVAVLWAAGIVRMPGNQQFQTATDAQLKGNPTPTAAQPGALPGTMPGSVPTTSPGMSPPAAASANPLLGEWINDSAEGPDCPAKVAFGSIAMTFTSMRSGTPQVEIDQVTYAVQSPTLVLVTNTSRASENATPTALPANIENGHLVLKPGCSFHR